MSLFKDVDLAAFADQTKGDYIQIGGSPSISDKYLVGLDGKPYGHPIRFINPDLAVAKLNNVIIKGLPAIPFSLEKSLCATQRITDNDQDPLEQNPWARKSEACIAAEPGDISMEIADPAFLLCMGRSDNNFGHFVWEVMMRVFAFLQIPQRERLKVLYPATLPERFLVWLAAAGIAREQLVPIPTDSAVAVRTLYISTAPFARSKTTDLIAHEDSLHGVRHAMFPTRVLSGDRARLFFGRADATHKRCVTEKEIYAILQRHDVKYVTGTTTSAEQQIAYLRDAELIIAPLGAASAAAAFAPADCVVVELTPAPDIFGRYNAVVGSMILGQPFLRLGGERVILPDNPNPDAIFWDYTFEPKIIGTVMRHFFNRGRRED